MSIFISYSHENGDIAEKIAMHLVKDNAHIWLDKWELRAGDSMLEKVQNALIDCSALLILLSKKSVESEWCKKELNSGLMRELDEKRVVVIPVLLEDCKVPLFLKEKLYSDFRGDFSQAVRKLSDDLLKFTDISMNRVMTDKYMIDWAIDTNIENDLLALNIDSISYVIDETYSILCNWSIVGNIKATQKAFAHRKKSEEFIDDLIDKIAASYTNEMRIILGDSKKRIFFRKFEFKNGEEYNCVITARWLGINDGFDKLFDLGNVLKEFSAYRRKQYKY